VLLQTGGAGPRSTAGWDELARGGVQRLPVPGGHHSMLMSPYVSGVAAALRSVLPDAPAVVEPSRDELATVHVA
jgi:thioesterase domain-containing protein